jgi:cell division initiation protein
VPLSPDDIVNHEFRQSLRGYNVAEVDALLDRLADQVERSEQEIDELRQRLRESEARLASALETESSIKRTLVTAQDAAERALADAREQADELRGACEREVTEQLERATREAEQLVEDAQQRASSELDAARTVRDRLTGHVERLREIEQHHRGQLRTHLEAQLAALEELDDVPAPPASGDEGAPAPSDPAAVAAELRSEASDLGRAHGVESWEEPLVPEEWRHDLDGGDLDGGDPDGGDPGGDPGGGDVADGSDRDHVADTDHVADGDPGGESHPS